MITLIEYNDLSDEIKSFLSGDITATGMVQVPTADTALIGKRYDFATGELL